MEREMGYNPKEKATFIGKKAKTEALKKKAVGHMGDCAKCKTGVYHEKHSMYK
jgi:hypothetical protein